MKEYAIPYHVLENAFNGIYHCHSVKDMVKEFVYKTQFIKRELCKNFLFDCQHINKCSVFFVLCKYGSALQMIKQKIDVQ